MSVVARLVVECARDLSDAELERVLSPCVGGLALVRAAKVMREERMLECKCDPPLFPQWAYCAQCEKLRAHFCVAPPPEQARVTTEAVATAVAHLPPIVETATPDESTGGLGYTGWTDWEPRRTELERPRMQDCEWVCAQCHALNSFGRSRCSGCALWRTSQRVDA